MLFLCPLTLKCFADLLVICLNLCVTMKKRRRLDAYEQKGVVNQGQGTGNWLSGEGFSLLPLREEHLRVLWVPFIGFINPIQNALFL